MADEDTAHTNGNGHEENGHVPEIELIIKVRKTYEKRNFIFLSIIFPVKNPTQSMDVIIYVSELINNTGSLKIMLMSPLNIILSSLM